MSQTARFPVLKVRNLHPGVTSGANVDVTLDGKKLNNLSFLKMEIHARKLAKVTMEMYVELDVEIEPGDPDITVKKVSGWKSILGDLQKKFFDK
jgi:hypothetical protein